MREDSHSLWGTEPIARVNSIRHVSLRIVLRSLGSVGKPVHKLNGLVVGHNRLCPTHEDDTASIGSEVVEQKVEQVALLPLVSQ